MAYLLVVLVAAAVGAAAYLMTLRQGAAHAAAGPLARTSRSAFPSPAPGRRTSRVTDTRLGLGVTVSPARCGLVIAVIAGAAALAFTTYAGASLLVKLIHRAVG